MKLQVKRDLCSACGKSFRGWEPLSDGQGNLYHWKCVPSVDGAALRETVANQFKKLREGEPVKTTAKKAKWPMIQVEYHGKKPSEIITMDQAAKRFRLDKVDRRMLESGQIAGTTVLRSGPANHDVRQINVYTEKDAHRDAAEELLATLKKVQRKLAQEPLGACMKDELINDIKAALRKARAI